MLVLETFLESEHFTKEFINYYLTSHFIQKKKAILIIKLIQNGKKKLKNTPTLNAKKPNNKNLMIDFIMKIIGYFVLVFLI